MQRNNFDFENLELFELQDQKTIKVNNIDTTKFDRKDDAEKNTQTITIKPEGKYIKITADKKKDGDFSITLGVNPENFKAAWELLWKNPVIKQFLLTHDLEIADPERLTNQIKIDQHYLGALSILKLKNTSLPNKTKKYTFDDQKRLFSYQKTEIVLTLFYQALIILQKLMAREKDPIKLAQYTTQFDRLLSIFLEMKDRNYYRYGTEDLKLLEDCYQYFIRDALPNTKAQLLTSTAIEFIKIISGETYLFSPDDLQNAEKNLNSIRQLVDLDRIGLSLNDSKDRKKGAQIIIQKIDASEKNEVISFIDEIKRVFEENNIGPGTNPHYAAKLNDYCALNSDYEQKFKRNNLIPTRVDFFQVPEHINPAMNPFFNEVTNRWLADCNKPLSFHLSFNASEAERWRYNFGKACLTKNPKEIYAAILTPSSDKGSLKFALHYLHDKKLFGILASSSTANFISLMRTESQSESNPILHFLSITPTAMLAKTDFPLEISNKLNHFSYSKQKLQVLEETFDYLKQNNYLQLYTTGNKSYREDTYRVNSLLQDHLKDLKNAYLKIVRENSPNKEILEIAKRSELVNFQRAKFELFFSKKTSTLKQIEKIENNENKKLKRK